MTEETNSSGLYRIRFHGRGGQGMKTASRILGTAFFLEGFQVQDAPRYGAERRGAPIFAYVRASRDPINERGVIHKPDLVIVADETLLAMPGAGVMHGVGEHTVLLVNSGETAEHMKERLQLTGPVFAFQAVPADEGVHGVRFVGVACVGAAARLSGVISRPSLEEAIGAELRQYGQAIIEKNIHLALRPYDLMAPYNGVVRPGSGIAAIGYRKPEWVELPFDAARVSAPAIFTPATSERVETGLWRTARPVLDPDLCKRCTLCAAYCPENAITVNCDGFPEIDYRHCKGCLICVEQCPARAIRAEPEDEGAGGNEEGDRS